ncbi:PREDICTED: uncharacterized protein LOC106805843 [Priapulus caudatus]|uniref:Hexosyltransferase n=1 Tax=Priapulus caudatus TaxID=37621 RepID=A0ABM1DT18_PRICU|nr:PREDICTED: uncharacterized protein LOC106805843 [Priapulus caudatus]XP_014663089.1 PREDICTED: uncharacterized protein LOC106805843 [Priapulus caudatus]
MQLTAFIPMRAMMLNTSRTNIYFLVLGAAAMFFLTTLMNEATAVHDKGDSAEPRHVSAITRSLNGANASTVSNNHDRRQLVKDRRQVSLPHRVAPQRVGGRKASVGDRDTTRRKTPCNRTESAIICEDGTKVVLRPEFYWTPDRTLPRAQSTDPGWQLTLASSACRHRSRPSILFDVHSKADHGRHRDLIRRTWASKENLSAFNAEVFFNLATDLDAGVRRDTDREADAYGDIVRSAHVEHYRNMTYKHVAGLRYSLRYCAGAKYVVKVDDDFHLNVSDLANDLAIFASDPSFEHAQIFCRVIGGQPNRSPRSKWFTPRDIYPVRLYPRYCFGGVIIYTMEAVRKIVEVSPYLPYFHIDDMHLTAHVAKALNIYPQQKIVLDFVTPLENLDETRDVIYEDTGIFTNQRITYTISFIKMAIFLFHMYSTMSRSKTIVKYKLQC